MRFYFFGRVIANHFRRILGDAGDKAVSMLTVVCVVVEVTNNNDFLVGETALKDDDGFVRSKEALHHLSIIQFEYLRQVWL